MANQSSKFPITLTSQDLQDPAESRLNRIIAYLWAAIQGAGVTSVALTEPSEFVVSGSPITDSGTLAVTKAPQSANKVWAGPSSGSPAQPVFRSLVLADLPGGVGTGTVTSVALTEPAEFVVSGSPVTTSGTLAVTKATQSANIVWAGPTSGGAAQPTFRALVIADLPVAVTVRVLQSIVFPSQVSYIPDIPYNFTITGWSAIGYGASSGSASVDLWFLAGSAPPATPSIPTSTNKISASAPVSISSAQAASGGSSAISTWTTALTQWGTMGFNPSSITGFTSVQVYIFGTVS